MKINCPYCKKRIEEEHVNVQKDVVFCSACNEGFSLANITSLFTVKPKFNIDKPPSGAWFEETEEGWTLGASTRSVLAIFIVPFSILWIGFTVGGTYGLQFYEGEFSLGTSLIGLVFLLVSYFLTCIALMETIGKNQIIIKGEEGTILEGVGPFVRKKFFNWSLLTNIREVEKTIKSTEGDEIREYIVLTEKSIIRFGHRLSDKRRKYLLQALKLLKQRTVVQ